MANLSEADPLEESKRRLEALVAEGKLGHMWIDGREDEKSPSYYSLPKKDVHRKMRGDAKTYAEMWCRAAKEWPDKLVVCIRIADGTLCRYEIVAERVFHVRPVIEPPRPQLGTKSAK